MLHVLAAEGGYQQFELGGAEWFWLLFSAATALLAILTGLLPDAWRPRRGPGHAEDDRDRHGDPGRSAGVSQTPVPHDPADPAAGRGHRVPHLDQGHQSRRHLGRADRSPDPGPERPLPHARLHRRLLHVRAHRLHRHEPGDPRQRTDRRRRQDRFTAATHSTWRSGRAASPACSRSVSACSAPR